MLVDLVQTTTRDGLRLDGTLQTPSAPGRPAGVDAVCLAHGTGGNFYNSTLFDSLADALLPQGYAVLRVNTRGHDGISTAATAQGGRRQGAAYEVVDDCRHDLAAWVDYLRQGIGPRVALVGHSLGAVKCLYALAHEPSPGAAGVVAISPPRLSYSWFCASPEGAEFRDTYALAERHVEQGRPAALMEVRLPLPLAITAAGYVEKYGPDEHYNYLRFITTVPCPVLVTLGSVEVAGNMAFRAAPEELLALAPRHGRLQVATVAGADHFYTGVRGEVAARVLEWLHTALA